MLWLACWGVSRVGAPRAHRRARIVPESQERTRQDWIDAAFEALVDEGPDALSVDGLTRALGASEASFGRHFGGLADLRAEVVAHWRRVSTVQVIARIETLGLAPRETLVELIRRALGIPTPGYGGLPEDPGALHVAVRSWARSCERVADEVARLEEARVRHIADLLVRAGIPRSLAEARAALAHAAVVGAELIRGPRPHPGIRVADFVDAVLAGVELD